MTELTADRVHIRQLLHLERNPGTWAVTLEPAHRVMTVVSIHHTWVGARWSAHRIRRRLRRRALAMMDHPTAGFPDADPDIVDQLIGPADPR